VAKQLSLGSVAVVVAVAVLLLATPARAQLGTGWNVYNPVERVQTRGCATYNSNGGVQRFGLSCGDSSGDNRAEQRVENDYSSGTNQFQGEVRVVSLGGSNVSLKQTFMPNNGAFLMLAVATPGRLYSVGDNADLAADIVGRWVRINTIHDVAAGTHEIWIDGVLKFIKRNGRQVAWHDKYGTYRLGSGRGPISAEWRNVQYWRGGRSPGGTPQPSPATDAGVAGDVGGSGDAIPGGKPGPDAGGTGGSEGTGGSGGSGGVAGSGGAGGGGGTGGGGSGGSGAGTGGDPGSGGSGAAGSGGAAGAGGRGGSSSRPDAGAGTGGGGVQGPAKATGCVFGGSRPGGAGVALLGLALIGLVGRRRARRR
jgi:hypothetical protein